MSRVLALALPLMAVGLHAAFAGPLEPLPAPASLPPYVAPLAVMDDVLHLPPGDAPAVGPAQVCYGPPAHTRLTLALQLAPALSDERARTAWLYGWRDAAAAAAADFDAEHSARLKAEATAHAIDARFQASERSDAWERWRQVAAAVGVLALGTAVGYAWGAP
jgi:hypothetical protein